MIELHVVRTDGTGKEGFGSWLMDYLFCIPLTHIGTHAPFLTRSFQVALYCVCTALYSVVPFCTLLYIFIPIHQPSVDAYACTLTVFYFFIYTIMIYLFAILPGGNEVVRSRPGAL